MKIVPVLSYDGPAGIDGLFVCDVGGGATTGDGADFGGVGADGVGSTKPP